MRDFELETLFAIRALLEIVSLKKSNETRPFLSFALLWRSMELRLEVCGAAIKR